MRLIRRVWAGEQALESTAPWGSVVQVPGRGGKIASIVDQAGREWLAQPDGDLDAVDMGASFADAEMCGWDEMAPTVRSPGRADHGDVWRAVWTELSADDRQVTLETSTPDFVLRRALTLSETGFALQYQARAVGPSVPFLWMAHPQFRADAHTTVSAEPSPRTARRDDRGVLVDEQWRNGHAPIAEVAFGSGRKIWLADEDRPTCVTLSQDDGSRLTMKWSGPLAAFALWTDHRWRSREPVICPEPATSLGDDVDSAARANLALRLNASEWTQWSVVVELGAGCSKEGGR